MSPELLSGWALAIGAFTPLELLGFFLCVAIAAWVQNLTGFAFGLVLISGNTLLTGLPVLDVAGAVTLLTLWQGWLFLRHHRLPQSIILLRPAMITSLIGVAIGVALLLWLSRHAVDSLQVLLGVVIILASGLLWLQRAVQTTVSGAGVFAGFGLISGVMGGLFSAAGPPLVWLMYRQPLALDQVRSSLTLMFMMTQGARLFILLALAAFSWRSALLSLLALPVVWVVARAHRRWTAHWRSERVRPAVAGLLLLSGVSLVIPVFARTL